MLNVHYKFTGNYNELNQHFKGGFDFSFQGYWHKMPPNGVLLYNWIYFLVPIKFSDLFREITKQLIPWNKKIIFFSKLIDIFIFKILYWGIVD